LRYSSFLDKRRQADKKLWDEIIEDIQNSDEILEGEPERVRFKTPEEIDSL
jgi:hypothetical protein